MKRTLITVLVALSLLAVLFAGATAQTFYTSLDHVIAKSLITSGDTSVIGNLAVTGVTAMTGNTSVGGTLAVVGDTSLSGLLSIATVDELTVANGGTITPTGTFQRLTAAGAVGAGLGAPTAGAYVMLLNTSANTITITDTTGAVLAGNAVLGQWDTLTIVGYGNSWHEVARSNN